MTRYKVKGHFLMATSNVTTCLSKIGQSKNIKTVKQWTSIMNIEKIKKICQSEKETNSRGGK